MRQDYDYKAGDIYNFYFKTCLTLNVNRKIETWSIGCSKPVLNLSRHFTDERHCNFDNSS